VHNKAPLHRGAFFMSAGNNLPQCSAMHFSHGSLTELSVVRR